MENKNVKSLKSPGLSLVDSSCLKGIGIFLMLYHHLFFKAGRFEGYDVSFWPIGQDTAISISLFCKVCVSFFVFVSGYGMLKSIRNCDVKQYPKWILRRYLKLMSGFFFVFILSCVVTQIVDGRFVSTYFENNTLGKGLVYLIFDFLGLSSLLGTNTLCGTWWYMAAATIYVLLTPVLYKLCEKVGYISVFAFSCLLPYLFKIDYMGNQNPYIFIPILLFGMFFARYGVFEIIESKLPKNKYASYLVCFIVFGIASIIALWSGTSYKYYDFWFISLNILPIAFILFARFCLIRIPVIKQVLNFVGKHSLTIFLTHRFIMAVYFKDFIYSFHNHIKIYFALIITSVALAIAIDLVKYIIRYDKIYNKFIIQNALKLYDKFQKIKFIKVEKV